jgi:hypothetical protein
MPTVIASFVGPDSKQQQKDLAPIFNAMGADAYVRALEAAKTRSAIRENEASALHKRAQANAEGKSKTTLDLDKRLNLQREMIKDVNGQVETDSRKDLGTDKVGFIAKEVERKWISSVIGEGRSIASSIIKYNFKTRDIPDVNAGTAYSVGKLIASANWMRKNYSINDDTKTVTPRFKIDATTKVPTYDELKDQRNPLISLYENGLFNEQLLIDERVVGETKDGTQMAYLGDGTAVPMDIPAKEWERMKEEFKTYLEKVYDQPSAPPAAPPVSTTPAAPPDASAPPASPVSSRYQALPVNEMPF